LLQLRRAEIQDHLIDELIFVKRLRSTWQENTRCPRSARTTPRGKAIPLDYK
jgi:hypothetical protein